MSRTLFKVSFYHSLHKLLEKKTNVLRLCSTGSGIGTLTFGPVLQYILQRYGLSTSLRILSGVSLLLLLAALTYRPFRSPLEELFEVKRQPRPFFDFSVWQNKAFCVYTAAVAIFMLGYFIPYVHLVSKQRTGRLEMRVSV